MPGFAPELLASIGASGGAPGMPPAPGGPPPGAGGLAEPVEIHDAALELCEVVKSALEMANGLIGQVELAEDVTPETEAQVKQALDLLTQADQLLDQVQDAIGQGRPDEGAAMPGDEASAAAGPPAPPV